MKNFTFSLEQVRKWREKQVSIEEARLERLFSEKALIEQRRVLLERDASESAALVHRTTAVEAIELRAIDAFRRHAIAQRASIATLMADSERRIADQQRAITEARRKFELLDRLKDKKWKAWNAEFAREIENQAGELYLAKWRSRTP